MAFFARFRSKRVRWALLALTLAGLGTAYSTLRRPPEAPQPPTAATELGDLVQTVQATGMLQPLVKVDVGAQVSGQIRRIHVQLGQQVRAGDVLVSLDPELARNDVLQAEAQLAQQTALRDSREIDIRAARKEAQRQHALMKGEATTAVELEKADTELAKLEADLRGQDATLARLRADLDKKRLSLGYTTVAAPISGEVVAIAVQEGQTVSALQTTPVLLTLAQMDQMTVRARIAEADVQAVHVDQAASFTTLAGDGKRYEGRIRVIQPIPERSAGAAATPGAAVYYNALFDVANPGHALLSEMTVRIDLTTGRASKVLTVPVVALGNRDEQGRYTVHVLDTQGKPQQRQIRLGLQDGVKAQVLEGLKAGEKVLLAPPPEGAASAPSAAH